MQEESKNKTDSQFLKTAVMRTVLQVGNIVKTDTEELVEIFEIRENKARIKQENGHISFVDYERLFGDEITEDWLTSLGFEIVRFKEPNYHVGLDRFYKYDYAILQVNKGTGLRDDLVIRFKDGKFILNDFYSVRFYFIHEIQNLISSFTRFSQTVA